MGNIQAGRLDLADLKYVDPAEADVAAYTLERGDLLFNRTNSPELVGKAAVFDAELPAVFASYLIRLTCDPRLADSRYVAFWINSPWGRQWARAVRTDCVSQSNINAAQLLALPVPLPPLAEQRRIVARVEALFARADAAEARVAAAVAVAEGWRRRWWRGRSAGGWCRPRRRWRGSRGATASRGRRSWRGSGRSARAAVPRQARERLERSEPSE